MLEKIFQKNEVLINYLYLINKILIINFSGFVAFKIRFIDKQGFENYFLPIAFFSFLYFLFEIILIKNERFYSKSFKKFINKELSYFFITLLILIFISAILKSTNQYSRIWIGTFIITSVLLLLVFKIFFNYFYDILINSNLFTKNVLLIGNFSSCKSLLKKFSNDPKYHFRIATFLDHAPSKKFFPIQQIELDDDLQKNIEFFSISQIWIISNENINRKKLLSKLSSIPVDVRTVYESDGHYDHFLERINGYNLFDTSLSPFFGLNYLAKLFLDYILASIFFVISLPILFFFGIIILLEDGRPIFFIQKRHGWDGKIINIYKLRSLKKTNDNDQVKKNDHRVLRVGKLIRRLSIDEFPQFINVLQGKMSIVGPRPHAIEHNDIFSKQIKGFMLRHKCKPGLTGLAQIRGQRGNINHKEQLKNRYESDVEYIKNWSIFLDIVIIFKTSFKIFFQKAH